ncbi:type II secretion system protein GspL [Sulfurifustis variabilis]|uniref:type II secretion system protein GspL n=1 Tax=Sulfurifustis variabilis TaxID=1675686 RepID=UPI000BBAF283|nr:type II secretion system protein GspL [Sulfurifustis variabilis]
MKTALNTLTRKAHGLGERLTQAARTQPVWLRLPRGWPESAGPMQWQACDADGAPHRGEALTLPDLPDFLRRARVQVWTPPSDTVLTRATLPTRSRARILQALPFALEDQLLADPEQLHFAYTPNPDGSLAVAVTDRVRVKTWLDTLAAAGIRPAGLCPGNLALPLQANAWSAAFVDDELWVRTGTASGFVCPREHAAPPALVLAALREAIAQSNAPQCLFMYGPPPDIDLDLWAGHLGIPVQPAVGDFWVATESPALNLLQGELTPTAHLRQVGRPLIPAAAMLAIWLVGLVTVDLVEWARLHRLHEGYATEMREILLKAFPETKTVLDPYAQMQRNLESLQFRGGGPSDLLPLLARVAPTVQDQTQAKLHGLKYAERALTLDVTLPDYQALDALKNRLQAANLEVEVVAANSRGGEVEGRLRIQSAGARAKPARSS